jgi:hypothetical protein
LGEVPEQHYDAWVMSVDLGQSMDFTAIAVIKHTRTPLEAWEVNEDVGR